MDGQQEMRELQEIFDVVKEITGFAGDILMQFPGRTAYVEEKGVQAILAYLESGGKAETVMVREELGDGMERQMEKCHVPYAAFEAVTEDEKRMRMYAFRDKDRTIIKDIIREMDVGLEDITVGAPSMREREKDMDVEPGL